MDFDTWVLIEQDMLEQKEKGYGTEKNCLTCAAFPCRCDHIYDSWRDDGVHV